MVRLGTSNRRKTGYTQWLHKVEKKNWKVGIKNKIVGIVGKCQSGVIVFQATTASFNNLN